MAFVWKQKVEKEFNYEWNSGQKCGDFNLTLSM